MSSIVLPGKKTLLSLTETLIMAFLAGGGQRCPFNIQTQPGKLNLHLMYENLHTGIGPNV